jgi:hypothetical protein
MLVDLVHKFIMVDVSSSNNNNVVSEEVGGVEVSEVISAESVENVSVTLNWLTHHVLSVYVEVSIFNGGLEVSMVVVFMLLVNFFLNKLELVLVESAV